MRKRKVQILNFDLYVPFKHASIFSKCLIHFRVAGGAVIEQEAGYTLDRSAVHHRVRRRQMRHTTIHTHTHSEGQFRVT